MHNSKGKTLKNQNGKFKVTVKVHVFPLFYFDFFKMPFNFHFPIQIYKLNNYFLTICAVCVRYFNDLQACVQHNVLVKAIFFRQNFKNLKREEIRSVSCQESKIDPYSQKGRYLKGQPVVSETMDVIECTYLTSYCTAMYTHSLLQVNSISGLT